MLPDERLQRRVPHGDGIAVVRVEPVPRRQHATDLALDHRLAEDTEDAGVLVAVEPATGSATLTVNKATPTVIGSPTSSRTRARSVSAICRGVPAK